VFDVHRRILEVTADVHTVVAAGTPRPTVTLVRCMSDSVRDEVRAALARREEAPLRTCPRCGREERTREEHCPHCGYSYFARPPAAARRRRIAVVTVALLTLAVVGVVIAILVHDKNDRNATDRAAHAKLVAAEVVRLRRIQAPHRGAATALKPAAGASGAQLLAARHRFVLAVQDAITADARHRVATGEIQGPVSHTECGPFLRSPDAVPDDRVLSKPIGRYDCVAIQSDAVQRGQTVGNLGYAFVAALDFRSYRYVICRNNPAQSEGGKALAYVRQDRACLMTKSAAVGTGYVDPDATP
jgi:ribosomal protein L37E